MKAIPVIFWTITSVALVGVCCVAKITYAEQEQARRQRGLEIDLLKELKNTDPIRFNAMRSWFKERYGYDYEHLEKQR